MKPGISGKAVSKQRGQFPKSHLQMARQIRVAEMDGVEVSILLLMSVKMEGPLRDLACAERANGRPRFVSKAGPLSLRRQSQDGTTGNFPVCLPWSLVWARGSCLGWVGGRGGGGQREHWKLSACFFRDSHMHPWIMDPIPHRMGMTTAGLGGPPIEPKRHGRPEAKAIGHPRVALRANRPADRGVGRLVCLRSTVEGGSRSLISGLNCVEYGGESDMELRGPEPVLGFYIEHRPPRLSRCTATLCSGSTMCPFGYLNIPGCGSFALPSRLSGRGLRARRP
jgi:hypothetical protein